MKPMTQLHWHTLDDVQKENNKASLIAMAYSMWGNCHLEKPPADFGEVMGEIGAKLGIAPLEKNLDKLAKELGAL